MRQVVIAGVGEVRRHDADDAIRGRTQLKTFGENAGVAAELRTPQRIADESDVIVAGAVVVLIDGAAEAGRRLHGAEEISGHKSAAEPERNAVAEVDHKR